MKKIYSLVAGLLLTASVFAQAPQKMSYQAVIRNSSNALLTSTPVGMQISILQGSSSGTAVYVETQVASTNANGLVSLEIGTGTVITGTFSAINWAAGPYFIKTETDPTGGTAYTIAGTNQLMSVPYALFSANGTPGATGAVGPTGAAGTNGTNGTNGLDGAVGATGATGANGTNGTNGTNGLDGAVGATGAAGTNGTNGLVGATGATGAAGTNGTNGAVGATGATGTNGTNGAVGATGAAGTNGTNGAVGATGAAGTNGTNGLVGATGAAGTNGTNGLVGATGATGTNGTNGLAGATGATGATGPTGLLNNGTTAGNTPYWDGTTWVVNTSAVYNTGGNIGIGTTSPETTAALDISSTSKGALLPRMLASQRAGIVSPATGLIVYQTDGTTGFYYFDGSIWQQLASGTSSSTSSSGSNTLIYTADGF